MTQTRHLQSLVICLLGLATAQSAQAEFGLQAATLLQGGSYSDSTSSSAVGSLGLQVFLNYDLLSLIPSLPFKLQVGPNVEYRFVSAFRAADETVRNWGGNTALIGIGIGTEFSIFEMGATFDFLGQHSLSVTEGSPAQSFTQPLGTRVHFGMSILPFLSLEGQFGYHKFSNHNVDLLSNTDNPMTEWTAGAGLRLIL